MSSNTALTEQVLLAFGWPKDTRVRVLSGGHINDTYLVNERFVLQRINHFVFPNPGDIMDNMLGVTRFLREKVLARGGDPDREILQIVPTAAGEPMYIDEAGNYWRCTLHIDGTASYETPDSTEMLYEAGRAFGDFQAQLSGYPAGTLHEIIPDFHNTPVRLQQLRDAAKADQKGRLRPRPGHGNAGAYGL